MAFEAGVFPHILVGCVNPSCRFYFILFSFGKKISCIVYDTAFFVTNEYFMETLKRYNEYISE